MPAPSPPAPASARRIMLTPGASCCGDTIRAPRCSLLAAATRVAAARARGAKLIVVDPRHIGFAVKADCWLRVRPGTDAALALALAGVMIDAGWLDGEFLRTWSNGPFLVREDDGTLLRAAVITAGGDG